MQDSSQNPYIPQENEAIRQKVYERQSPLGRIVKWALIATVVVAVLVGIGLIFVVPKTSTVDQPARVKLANALQSPDQTLKRVNVQSLLGFKLNYDNHIYSSYAEVGDSTSGTDSSAAVISGQTYENNDLRVSRAYNYVRIRPIESVDSARALAPIPPELQLFATVTDQELTKAAAVPENKGLSKLSLFVKIDGDKRLAKKVADDKTVVTIEATKPASRSIGGVDYQKVRYTTTNENHRISNVKYDDCYYTIQYNQPYAVCIANVRPSNVSAASLVEGIFDTITFEQPAVTGSSASTSAGSATKQQSGAKSSYVAPLARLAQATVKDKASGANDAPNATSEEGDESPLLDFTPAYYGDAGSLNAIALNQPSVVRIGTLYCADLSLKFESGDTAASLTDACVGTMATGVVVSKDGYIATTGHAIRAQKKAAINGYINFGADRDEMLDRLQRVLDYLLKAKIILQSDADYLKTGASGGDQEALAKIQNITSVIPDDFIIPVNEQYSYAIQPTDKPIVINRSDSNKPSFAYSDSVISAKYVSSDYDATKSVQNVFGSATPSADVGLLKADGAFQEVSIAAKEDAKSNDTLSTIGFPAYTDSSLTIDKIRNDPVATVSKVEQAYKKDDGRLIQTDTPVLPGNDGAPVFDTTGKLIGFAVYGLSYCPDQQCFANGTVRSSAELLKLLDESNIKLQIGSNASQTWRDGVTEYFRANYAASSSAFKTAASLYPFNHWAEPLQKLAVANQGTAADTSLMNQLQAFMIWALVVLVLMTILLTVAFVIHRKRINQLQVGHYGADEQAPFVASPPQAPAPAVSAQQYGVPGQLPPVQPQAPPQVRQIPVQSPPAATPQQFPTGGTQPSPSAPQQPPSPTEDPFYK